MVKRLCRIYKKSQNRSVIVFQNQGLDMIVIFAGILGEYQIKLILSRWC